MNARTTQAQAPHALRATWLAWNALQLLFTLAWTGGWICLGLPLLLLGGMRPVAWLARRVWAPGLLWGAGARLRVHGLEQVDWSAPCVLACNHQSVIDACALVQAVPAPLHFVLKRELRAVPLLGWYARAMGMVFVDRRNPRAARASLLAAAARLRAGQVVCAFPEGTRSGDGTVAPFRRGAFQLAIEAGVPVVPVAVDGGAAVLPPKGFRVRPGPLAIRFGAPIPTTGLDAAQRSALAERVQHQVVALLQQQRAHARGGMAAGTGTDG